MIRKLGAQAANSRLAESGKHIVGINAEVYAADTVVVVGMLENGGGWCTVLRSGNSPLDDPLLGDSTRVPACCPRSSALNSSRYSCRLLPTTIFLLRTYSVDSALPALRIMSVLFTPMWLFGNRSRV